MLALAAITLLGMFSPEQGAITERWFNLLRMGFGWGAYSLFLVLGVAGLWLILKGLEYELPAAGGIISGSTILGLALLAFLHLIFSSGDPWGLVMEGRGGGWIGWALSELLAVSVGNAGAVVVLLALGIIGATLALRVSILDLGAMTIRFWRRIAGTYGRRSPQFRINEPRTRRGEDRKLSFGPPPPERKEKTQPPASVAREGDEMVAVQDTEEGRRWRVPNPEEVLDLETEQEISQAELRDRGRLIEETLGSFGVPVKVVEVNQGPVVTQFGIEPGYIERRGRAGQAVRSKVKVSKIVGLAKDLALALSASPVRVEAPVPGRPLVGIEVPNVEVSMVGLRGVLESEEYVRAKGELKVGLGRDVTGRAAVADLAAMPHLLIAGATGSGKSVCINSVIAALLCQKGPEEMKLLMIDPKRVELSNFKGIPHLVGPVVSEVEKVIGALRWAVREMEDRYRRFAEAGARNIRGYNRKAGEVLPYIVVIVDELADLMMAAPEEVERLICRIAQMARATGIHLVVATQRPSVDVVTGLIKANFPTRVSFAVASGTDSRVILDMVGAEKLLGRGDMLYMSSESSKVVRLQGCYVSDAELGRLVRFWRKLAREEDSERVLATSALGETVTSWDRVSLDEEGDDLLEEAKELIRERGEASVSLLQRRMRIGYPRAARLMDELEKEGLVGPARAGGKTREVLAPYEQATVSPTGLEDLEAGEE